MSNLSVNSVVSACEIHLEPDHFFIDFTVIIISHPNYSNSIINGFYHLLVLLWSIFSTWSDPLKHVSTWHFSLQNFSMASKHKHHYRKGQRFPCPAWSDSHCTPLTLHCLHFPPSILQCILVSVIIQIHQSNPGLRAFTLAVPPTSDALPQDIHMTNSQTMSRCLLEGHVPTAPYSFLHIFFRELNTICILLIY